MIETERLILRLPEAGDAEELGAIFSEPETMRFVGGVVSPGEIPTRINRIRSRWKERGFGALVVERRDDGRVVGDVAVEAWDTDTWDIAVDLSLPHEFEIGWLLGRSYQGFGYATEAARALREWAMRELRPPRLISLISAENEASAAVALRLGCVPADVVEVARFGLSRIWVHP